MDNWIVEERLINLNITCFYWNYQNLRSIWDSTEGQNAFTVIINLNINKLVNASKLKNFIKIIYKKFKNQFINLVNVKYKGAKGLAELADLHVQSAWGSRGGKGSSCEVSSIL